MRGGNLQTTEAAGGTESGYEVGKCYDIESVSGTRTHGGDRSNSSVSAFSITVEGELSFISAQRLQ